MRVGRKKAQEAQKNKPVVRCCGRIVLLPTVICQFVPLYILLRFFAAKKDKPVRNPGHCSSYPQRRTATVLREL
jgi:hypothetical protein